MSAWRGIVGQTVRIDEFKTYIANLPFTPPQHWRPSGGTLHNTATPNMARGEQFTINHWRDMWVDFFRSKGWPSGPHAFIFNTGEILLFTAFNVPGTHSPSWNGTKFGIEMVADFDKEDDDTGKGLVLKKTAAAVFATLYQRLGLDPEGIKMHYEDKATTHACPGKHIDKEEFIDMVQAYMGHAGEHPSVPPTIPIPPVPNRVGIVNTPDLNLRIGSSASQRILVALPKGERLDVLGEAKNGRTVWLRVRVPRLKTEGWVSGQYVDL